MLSSPGRFFLSFAVAVGLSATLAPGTHAHVRRHHSGVKRAAKHARSRCPRRHARVRHRSRCVAPASARTFASRSKQSSSPVNSSPPSISGTAIEGQVLSASTGKWAGTPPMHYAYQWRRDSSNVSGSTGSSYLLTSSDVGHQLTVVVIATNAYGSASATSPPTATVTALTSSGGSVSPPPPTGETAPTETPATLKFIGSIDTMKLSKDQAAGGFTAADGQAVDLAATTAATHITDNAPLEYPSVMMSWANRIHVDGKSVWFRLNATGGGSLAHGDLGDGYPTFAPGYLTKLHLLMLGNPGLFRSGDILDGDSEAENSSWWTSHYGCGVQASCTPCNEAATNTPCAPVYQFNHFLVLMTEQENRDLKTLGITGVDTTVHSTDPGTAQHQLYASTVEAMGNKITVDAYPDQGTTDPTVASNAWTNALNGWHQTWSAKGIDVKVLVGEWGYSNALNVSDSEQQTVIHAEVTQALPTIPFLLGTNYWVGPGSSSSGGYTYLFRQVSGVWTLRPAAIDISAFYAAMNAG
jgi:hypothetical protein